MIRLLLRLLRSSLRRGRRSVRDLATSAEWSEGLEAAWSAVVRSRLGRIRRNRPGELECYTVERSADDEVQRDPRPDRLLELVEWDALAEHERGLLRCSGCGAGWEEEHACPGQ